MDIVEEFASLGLPRAKQALAWDARAKITWGDPAADVQTWLVANGIDNATADRIVAIAVRERALMVRAQGTRDLVLGILACVGGGDVGIGIVMIAKHGLVAIPIRGLAVIAALAFLAFLYGGHLTWRGLARIMGGSRVKGAVSEVGDWP